MTWQQCTRDASKKVSLVSARISRVEGMEGHARCSDVRMKKFFPDEAKDMQLEP